MRQSILLGLLLIGLGCASASPEERALYETVSALGGGDGFFNVNALVLEGDGTNWNVGQDMTIDATGQTFTVTNYRRSLDLTGGRMLVQQTRTPTFAYFQGPQPQQQVFGLDGDIAYSATSSGNATRGNAQAVRDRTVDLYHHPVVLMRAALGGQAKLSNLRTEGGERLLDITLPSGQLFTLLTDASTHIPTRVRSASYHPNLGDVIVETTFSDYADAAGLTLPRHLVTSIDRFKSTELRLSRATVPSQPEDLTAPLAVRNAPQPGPPPVTVSADVIAPGVWLLGGQSHHSALVEFSDHLLLIEAPQSEARTLAVIAKAREVVPGKPLTHLLSSHFHFDHSAGLRAAVAAGLTVITHEGNTAYYKEAAERPHTLQPDTLAKAPRPITLEGVGDARVLEDATRRVELYHIAGNPHGDTLLMAYLPRERVLIEADAFSPGGTLHPYAANLLEQIRTRKLRVDRIVPLHGPVAPLAELVKAVTPS
jgi:glyoxylase-like metal-dependent hydrolase (beta-lactamase superfamily II)